MLENMLDALTTTCSFQWASIWQAFAIYCQRYHFFIEPELFGCKCYCRICL